MIIELTSIADVWKTTSHAFYDERGNFAESFKESSVFHDTGKEFGIKQLSYSSSNKSVIRGVHYSLSPIPQFKWITCIRGSILDIVTDIRIGSETFGKCISFELQAGDGVGVLILDRLGHSFYSREDGSILSYALSTEYEPSYDRTINPLDKELNIPWPQGTHILSLKDSNAPTLMQLSEESQLPLFFRSN